MRTASPLRYPGGKWRFSEFFARLIASNFTRPPFYVEPYSGGGSLALSLLYTKKVSRIHLNDLDPAIFAFWQNVLNNTEEFIALLVNTPVDPEEWQKQRQIYRSGGNGDSLALGFSLFFLNRTSHSGILNAGMIGGLKQEGEWKIDARFNRADLVQRVRRVAAFRKKISLTGVNAVDLLSDHERHTSSLVYLDPPYYNSGRHLYLNSYRPDDHILVRDAVVRLRTRWVVSYDDAPEISSLYSGFSTLSLKLRHTARAPHVGSEVMFFSKRVTAPCFEGLGNP